jgi:hypothetical protein
MEGVQMSDNILTKSTDLGIGNVTVGNLVEMMRGTPPPTWEQTCLDLDKKLADSRQYVTQLENRLRALWDKLEGERKYYEDRIKRLEEAGDALANNHNPFTFIDWNKAKEAKL